MTTTPRRRLLALSVVLGIASLGLAACATPTPGSADAPTPGPEMTESGDGGMEVGAAWLDDGRAVAIVTYGSSSCVPMAEKVTYADGVLTLELLDPEGQACTRDMVPRASMVELPKGVDPTEDLDIVITGMYAGDTDLDGDAKLTGVPGEPTEYLPSAGWYDDGGFVILTWGSSGCPPVLEDAQSSGPAEVTVTFTTPDANTPCTADMAPRLTMAVVPEPAEDDDVQLILTGGGFDDVTLRIAGSS